MSGYCVVAVVVFAIVITIKYVGWKSKNKNQNKNEDVNENEIMKPRSYYYKLAREQTRPAEIRFSEAARRNDIHKDNWMEIIGPNNVNAN